MGQHAERDAGARSDGLTRAERKELTELRREKSAAGGRGEIIEAVPIQALTTYELPLDTQETFSVDRLQEEAYACWPRSPRLMGGALVMAAAALGVAAVTAEALGKSAYRRS